MFFFGKNKSSYKSNELISFIDEKIISIQWIKAFNYQRKPKELLFAFDSNLIYSLVNK